MRNTVLAVQPDSFPKIRRIGTKIENPLLRVPRNYSSRVEFSKSDRYSGAGHEYRRGIVPGLENRLTLRLTYIPSREKKDSAVWAHAIQYNSPSTGPPPFFRNRLLRRLKAALSRASPSKRREEKKDSIRGIRGTLCKCGSEDSPVLPLRSSVVHVYRLYDLTRSLLGHVRSFVIFVKVCFVATL